ncbi:His-Xaa-Ser repeat protein HxsA2 [Pseudomonas fluorescens]|uniref:His-Xaa-Ser repeat protein HxsA2 n=1 Tax=Pseudomonas fluorescens TaxID=294 RepID=UPI00123F57EC
MKKRSFLVPMATLAAAVATEQSTASVHQVVEPVNDHTISIQTPPQSENISVRSGDDLFAFVLKRGEQGQFMASHSSHSSHASHSSHSSHHSGS